MGESLKLCMGCMNPIDENEVCEICGYVDGTPFLPSYLPPKTVLNDRYIVGKLLNYNGEGATYIGYDKVINMKVQIREFFPDTLCTRVHGSNLISINPNKLVQFKNLLAEFSELNKALLKMRTLSHICSALEFFTQNNTAYTILEYTEGITLKHYIQDNAGELSWQQVKELFPPIFTTLSLIHNAGIVHRGISLDTIIYTEKGELKITGFCTTAARTANSDIAPELFAGYAAPEQYSYKKCQGTWTDVYAISAVLYRALTGCMPTEAVSRIGNDSLLEPIEINYNIRANISKTIMAGMKLDGEKRIQTVTELVTKLFEQGEFAEQSHVSSSTVIIPKQTLPTKNAPVEEKKAMNSSRVFLIVMGGTFLLVILILLIVLIILNTGSNKSKQTDNNSIAPIESSLSDNDKKSNSDSSSSKSSALSSSSTADNKELIEVPELVGTSYEGLNEVLKKNLQIIPTYEYNEKEQFTKDVIFEQSIEKGKTVPAGTKINIKVSKGSQFITIPDYIGMTEQQYRAELSKVGIKYGDPVQKETSEFQEGYVVNLNKNAGDKIDITKNEVVIIYVAKKPASTTSQPN